MSRMVDISYMPLEEQDRIAAMAEASRRAALLDDNRLMTPVEAAAAYGYTHQTIRIYVCRGIIESTGFGPTRRISHEAMRKHMRRSAGRTRPRNSERE